MADVIDMETGKERKGQSRRGQSIKNEHGLTVKQEAFAQSVAKGNTLAQSYRDSYETSNMKPSSVWTRASKLMDVVKVQSRVDALVAEAQAGEVHDAARLRRFVVERLHVEALNAGSDSARVRALELMGKLTEVQAFADHIITEDLTKKTAEELQTELEERLGKLSA